MKQATLDRRVVEELGNAMVLVQHMLKEFPDTRNDDRLLIDMTDWYCRSHRMDLLSPETITRARRKIQYRDKKYLADKDVEDLRREKGRQYEEFFSD